MITNAREWLSVRISRAVLGFNYAAITRAKSLRGIQLLFARKATSAAWLCIFLCSLWQRQRKKKYWRATISSSRNYHRRRGNTYLACEFHIWARVLWLVIYFLSRVGFALALAGSCDAHIRDSSTRLSFHNNLHLVRRSPLCLLNIDASPSH